MKHESGNERSNVYSGEQWHVMGVKDSKIIFHAQYNKIMNEKELLEYVKVADELINDEIDSDK